MPLQRGARCPRCSSDCGRSAATDRRASIRCVRARSTAVSRLRAAAGGSRDAAALRRLQLHQDGAEALRQRVVDVARDAVALLEHRLPARFEQALIGEPAVIERERGLTRRGVDAAPGATRARTGVPATLDSAIQPSVFGASTQRRDQRAATPAARLNARTGSGSRASSPS